MREYSVDLLEMMRVGEVMDKDVPTILEDMTVAELSKRIADNDPALSRRQGTLIIDAGQKLSGIITRGDIVRSLQRNPAGTATVLDAGQREMIVAYPEEPLHDAISRMIKHDVGRLPVLEHRDSRRIIGYLGRASILAARVRHHEEEAVCRRGC